MGFASPGPAMVLATSWTLIVLATGVVAARLYLRLRIQRRRLLSSDMIMCAAWLFAIITNVFGPVFAAYGALDPEVHTSLQGYKGRVEDLELVLQLFFASYFPYYTTFYLCKAALLAVYLQVFPDFMVKRRIFLWVTIGFVAVSYVATIVLIFCICLPLERNWAISITESCPGWTYAVSFQVGWGLHFLGDLLVFILPWLIVPALNVKKALKLGIYLTFLLGTINIAFCLIRFVNIQRAGEDYSISLSTIVLWSYLDVNVGLVVACLPSLRPYFGSRSSSGYPTANSHSKSTSGQQSEAVAKVQHPRFLENLEDGTTVVSGPSSQRDDSVTYAGTEEEISIWEDGKRGNNASDVELVQMRLAGR
ncbi:hypothetical protein NM208_g15314 [Fusarium decemcellulare]|uniref:Uncharacterized protein n=1 Tax=Fusarium decemcellulare TaxID=57161 RepID=A0ACC1REU8_9HYPO|nr:hypothetical protein NM208_g15314 [Fusarium decemcellulare]